jgi:hypothetical protein
MPRSTLEYRLKTNGLVDTIKKGRLSKGLGGIRQVSLAKHLNWTLASFLNLAPKFTILRRQISNELVVSLRSGTERKKEGQRQRQKGRYIKGCPGAKSLAKSKL